MNRMTRCCLIKSDSEESRQQLMSKGEILLLFDVGVYLEQRRCSVVVKFQQSVYLVVAAVKWLQSFAKMNTVNVYRSISSILIKTDQGWLSVVVVLFVRSFVLPPTLSPVVGGEKKTLASSIIIEIEMQGRRKKAMGKRRMFVLYLVFSSLYVQFAGGFNAIDLDIGQVKSQRMRWRLRAKRINTDASRRHNGRGIQGGRNW